MTMDLKQYFCLWYNILTSDNKNPPFEYQQQAVPWLGLTCLPQCAGNALIYLAKVLHCKYPFIDFRIDFLTKDDL